MAMTVSAFTPSLERGTAGMTHKANNQKHACRKLPAYDESVNKPPIFRRRCRVHKVTKVRRLDGVLHPTIRRAGALVFLFTPGRENCTISTAKRHTSAASRDAWRAATRLTIGVVDSGCEVKGVSFPFSFS